MLLASHQVILHLLSVESRVQDPEGGGVGDHERELWRHRRTDQVPRAARLHTSSLWPAHRHGQQDCAGETWYRKEWELNIFASGCVERSREHPPTGRAGGQDHGRRQPLRGHHRGGVRPRQDRVPAEPRKHGNLSESLWYHRALLWYWGGGQGGNISWWNLWCTFWPIFLCRSPQQPTRTRTSSVSSRQAPSRSSRASTSRQTSTFDIATLYNKSRHSELLIVGRAQAKEWERKVLYGGQKICRRLGLETKNVIWCETAVARSVLYCSHDKETMRSSLM